MILLARQHLLPSTNWLLDKLVQSDKFSAIRLFPKDYSTVPGAFRELSPSIEIATSADDCFLSVGSANLLLLDEGGGLHRALPLEQARLSAGVEQTSFGLSRTWKCPIVLVCRSAAKLMFESQIIARGILRKLTNLDLLKEGAVGIIGLGALGSELARSLIDHNIPTFGFDARRIPSDLVNIHAEVGQILERCDLILGCTGADSLAGADFTRLRGQKVFASCSSSDVEFRSLLAQLPKNGLFETVTGYLGEAHCVVLNAGFPVNFDREQEWEIFDEIVLTRKLMFEGLFQSSSELGTAPRPIMLDPAIQLRVVSDWLDRVPQKRSIRIPNALDERFFRVHSEGEHSFSGRPSYTLHCTTPLALANMRSHHNPYEATVLGLPILIMPNVWSPAYDWSSQFHVENLPDVRGLDVLEIGCGTGVISVFAAAHFGAKRVLATDVHDQAVENARRNLARFNIDNARAVVSNLFENVQGQFDVIVWNAPYHGSKPRDMLESACADEEYRAIRRFFREVSNYLRPGGMVIVGFSESGDLSLLENLIEDNGFRVRKKLSDWRQGYNCMIFELVVAPRC